MEAHERFQQALRRRDALRAQVQRVQGKLEAAREKLASIEEESRQKGVEPENLPVTIEKLKAKFEQGVTALEEDLKKAESLVAPYLEG